MLAWVTMDKYKHYKMLIDNCAPFDITLAWNEVLGVFKLEQEQCIPHTEETIAAVISDIHKKFPKVPKKIFSWEEIEKKANLQVPIEYKNKYVNILFKHQDPISINKFDLGCAKKFFHKIHLKKMIQTTENCSNYQRHSKLSLKQPWMNGSNLKRSNSLNNTPLFCVPKKQGHGLIIVQDLMELNTNSHINKYVMKEITQCIGNIGHANSTIFFYLGPYFWLLANETGWGLSTPVSFHNTW